MAFNLQAYNRVAGIIDGDDFDIGSIESPLSISVTGLVYDYTTSIANAANAVMYSNTLAGFGYLYIVSDYDLRLLITNNASASFSVTLLGSGTANKMGLALQLGSDDTTSSSVIINALQVFNESGSTAKCRAFIVQ